MPKGEKEMVMKILKHLMTVMVICALVCTTVLPLQVETAAAASKAPGRVTLKQVTKNGQKLTVKWEAVSDASGYEIQYANNRLFFNKSSVDVAKQEATSKKIKKLSEKTTYYVRIRAYAKEGHVLRCSAWTLSPNAYADRNPNQIKRTPVTVKSLIGKKSKFELRKAVKEKVGAYDTVQGSCCYNGYIYFVLENRNAKSKKCKIAKVRRSNMKVVKISKAMNLGHGNDMTYDTKRNRLVVAHSTPVPKVVSIVNPNTLKKKGSVTVNLPNTIEGISAKTLKRYKKKGTYTGFGAIAYNSAHDQFVVTLRGQKFHHLMILDSNFKPVRFIWLDRDGGQMAKQMVQSSDSFDDYIMVAQSYGYGYRGNNILVYNWDGEYLSKLNLGTTYELESIFHHKGTMHVCYYTSGYTKSKITKKRKLYRRSFVYTLSGY